jgi:hypothetical protein
MLRWAGDAGDGLGEHSGGAQGRFGRARVEKVNRRRRVIDV